MRISLPELEIGPAEGFDPKKDIFQRKQFGEGLTYLLSRLEEPAVIALDAPWGSGKTTFVKMWQGHLRNSGFPVIRFDAFYNDYQQDAFAAIAGEVIAYSKRHEVADTREGVEFRKQAVEVGKVLLRGALRLGVKAGTLGVLDAADIDALGGITSDIAEAASGAVEDLVRARLEKHDEDRQTFATFRTKLAEISAILPAGTADAAPVAAVPERGERRPLIFIIDELDRCRPTYSLAILETIKHFFSVANVHFVLVTHMEQLAASVSYAYGSGVDAPTYLQKFYTFAVQLPDKPERRAASAVRKYIDLLSRSLVSDAEMKNLWGNMTEFLADAAEEMNLSLRTVERIATLCSLAIGYAKPNFVMVPIIVAGLCVMRVVRPDLYVRAGAGTLEFRDAADFFGFSRWPEEKAKVAVYWWRFCMDPTLTGEDVDQRMNHFSFTFDIDDRKDIIPILAHRVIDRFMLPPA